MNESMSTIKVHAFVVRLAFHQKEAFILAPSPQMARAAYNALMPEGAPSFKESLGDWANVDITKAKPPELKP